MLAAALAASALLACAASGAGIVAVLHLLPLALLGMLLLVGRYPGEARLADRLCPAARAAGRSRDAARPGAGLRPGLPRGGLLMGLSLAVRPPPAAACRH